MGRRERPGWDWHANTLQMTRRERFRRRGAAGLRHRPGGEELGRWHGQKRRARGALRRRQFELAQRFPCPAQPGQYSETTTGARSAEPRCGPTRRSRRCARWRPTRRAARPARRASAFGSARDDASSATATCPPAQTRPRPPCRVSTSTTSPAAAVTTTCRCRPRATACPQPASTSASSRHSRSVASRCAVTRGRRSTRHRHRRDPRVRPRGDRRQDRGRRRVRQPRTPPAPPRRLHRLPAAQATHPAARPGRVALVCTAARGLRAQDRRAASRVHRQPDPGDGPSCSGKYTHISAGYRAANAGYVSHGVRRLNRMVPMARDSPLHEGLSRLLPHAIDLLERNEGVPLAPRARFGAGPGRRSDGCIGTQSSGSRESQTKPRAKGTSDSCGKYAEGWDAPRRAPCIHFWKRPLGRLPHQVGDAHVAPQRNCARRCVAPGCEGGPGHVVAPACGSRSGMGAARSSLTDAGSRLRWLAQRLPRLPRGRAPRAAARPRCSPFSPSGQSQVARARAARRLRRAVRRAPGMTIPTFWATRDARP